MASYDSAIVEYAPPLALFRRVRRAAVLAVRPYVEAVVDTTAPVVSGISPAAGAAIGSSTAVGFDVTDETALRRVVIHAIFAAKGIADVVHDGVTFAPLYADSTRTAIAGGYRYRLRRKGGWPASPSIVPIATDTGGNEAV